MHLIWFLKVSGNTTWDLNRDPGRCQPRVPCPCRSSEWRYDGPSSVYLLVFPLPCFPSQRNQATFFRSCFCHISGASAAIGTLLMGIFTRASSYFPVRWKPTGWPKQAETGKDMLFVKPSNPTARSHPKSVYSIQTNNNISVIEHNIHNRQTWSFELTMIFWQPWEGPIHPPGKIIMLGFPSPNPPDLIDSSDVSGPKCLEHQLSTSFLLRLSGWCSGATGIFVRETAQLLWKKPLSIDLYLLAHMRGW